MHENYNEEIYNIDLPHISIHLCKFCDRFFNGDFGSSFFEICDNCMLPSDEPTKTILERFPRLKFIKILRDKIDNLNLFWIKSKEEAISNLDEKYKLQKALEELNK